MSSPLARRTAPGEGGSQVETCATSTETQEGTAAIVVGGGCEACGVDCDLCTDLRFAVLVEVRDGREAIGLADDLVAIGYSVRLHVPNRPGR